MNEYLLGDGLFTIKADISTVDLVHLQNKFTCSLVSCIQHVEIINNLESN